MFFFTSYLYFFSWYHSQCVGSSKLADSGWSCMKCHNSIEINSSESKIKSAINGFFKSKDEENDIKVTAVVKPTRKEILEKTNNVNDDTFHKVLVESEKITRHQGTDSAEMHALPIPTACTSPGSFSDQESYDNHTNYDSEIVDTKQSLKIDKTIDTDTILKNKIKRDKKIKKLKGKTRIKFNSEKKIETKYQKSKQDSSTNKKSHKKIKKESDTLIEVRSGKDVCKLCGIGWNVGEALELGPLYKYGVCQAHLHCLLFSSGLVQVKFDI